LATSLTILVLFRHFDVKKRLVSRPFIGFSRAVQRELMFARYQEGASESMPKNRKG